MEAHQENENCDCYVNVQEKKAWEDRGRLRIELIEISYTTTKRNSGDPAVLSAFGMRKECNGSN